MRRSRYLSDLNLKGNVDKEKIIETCRMLNCHEQKLYAESQGGVNTEMTGFKALAFDFNSKPYTVVSDGFGILQHEEVARDTFNSLDELGINYQPVSLIVNDDNKRNSIKMSILLPDLKFEVDGQPVYGVVNVYNGNDSGMAFKREFALYRMWCSNGMAVISEEVFKEIHRHTKNIEMLNMKEGMESLTVFHPIFAQMLIDAQQIGVNDLVLQNLAMMMKLSPLFMERLPELWSHYENMVPEKCNMNTVWGLYQVMTNYISNQVAVYNIAQATTMNNKLYAFMQDTISRRVELAAAAITAQ